MTPTPIAARLRALRNSTDFISLRAELLAIAEECERLSAEMREPRVIFWKIILTWADELAGVRK